MLWDEAFPGWSVTTRQNSIPDKSESSPADQDAPIPFKSKWEMNLARS